MRVQKRGKNLDKKLWLSRYQEYREEASDNKEEADRLREELFPSAQKLSGMPRNPSPKQIDQIWAEHISAINTAEEAMRNANERLLEISAAIESLEDSDQRTVLKKRYCHGYNWLTIADTMHRSVESVTKLHGRALDKISVPIDTNDSVR